MINRHQFTKAPVGVGLMAECDFCGQRFNVAFIQTGNIAACTVHLPASPGSLSTICGIRAKGVHCVGYESANCGNCLRFAALTPKAEVENE